MTGDSQFAMTMELYKDVHGQLSKIREDHGMIKKTTSSIVDQQELILGELKRHNNYNGRLIKLETVFKYIIGGIASIWSAIVGTWYYLIELKK